jgi:flagellin
MSLVINTNSIATTATRNLEANSANLARSLARLSSGSKIVIPSDDAGGLAVSTKLNAALNRNVRAQQNVQNSLSFLQVQDGALKVATSVLDRMSELKTMSLDPTKNASDLENYNTEFKQLQTQLSSIYGESFNGISVFDDSTNLSAYTTEDGATSVNLTRNGLFDEISTVNATQRIIGAFVGLSDAVAVETSSIELTVRDGTKATISLTASNAADITGAIKAINDQLEIAGITSVTASESTDGKLVINTTEKLIINETVSNYAGTGLIATVDGSVPETFNGTAQVNAHNNLAVYDAGDIVNGTRSDGTAETYVINATHTGAGGSFDDFAAAATTTRLDNSMNPGVAVHTADATHAAGTVVFDDADGRYYLTRGAVLDSNYTTAAAVTALDLSAVPSEFLSLGNSIPSINGTSAYDSSKAYQRDDIISYDGNLYVASGTIAAGSGNPLTNASTIAAPTGWVKINVAISGSNNLLDQDKDISDFNTSDFQSFIQTASTARAQNGAEMQRLNWSDEMLKTNHTNMEAAHSRLADVDIATESTQFAKNNILVQSATAMLSQANNLPSVALQLLQ